MRKRADHGYNPQVLTTTSHSHNSFNTDSVAGHESNLGNCFLHSTLFILQIEGGKVGENKKGGKEGRRDTWRWRKRE